MNTCSTRPPEAVELYFYGELTEAERARMAAHLRGCRACRQALEDLTLIRAALAAQPHAAAPAGGDWTRFMSRLQAATVDAHAAHSPRRTSARRAPVAAGLAAAALFALVTIAVLMAIRQPASPRSEPTAAVSPVSLSPAPDAAAPAHAALVQMSEAHFERAKLVVLGLATKEPSHRAEDWDYERRLATTLLDDTRLYRQAAEESGLKTLAGVMRDLEVVLLQTAMSERPDADSLAQLQRLIGRRDLITKMNVVASAGLMP
jgi:Putative zinc-finger